jgi:trans-aconitate 2-methyltransferase
MSGWNPGLYQASHSFVWEFGRELIQLLAPQPGERILDLGCGTGQLTQVIAETGSAVVGMDRSRAMVQEARRNCPHLPFAVADATALPCAGAFDAVFSNAVLHWVRDAAPAVAGIRRALKREGRFVAEFGGRGNIARLLTAVYRALRELGVRRPEDLNPWYFPSVGEYATLLEQHGLEVNYAALFDRLTPLEPGAGALTNWLEMFCGPFLKGVQPQVRGRFIELVQRFAAPELQRDGVWSVDYRRLRIAARRV